MLDQGSKAAAHASKAATRILVVDDDALNRSMLTAILVASRHEVLVAADAATACRLAVAQSFDLVLLDVDMPDMDGYACAAAIRDGESAGEGVRIVALSAVREDELRPRAAHAGCDAVITRPVTSSVLLKAIDQALASERHIGDGTPIWNKEDYDHLVRRLGADRMSGFLASLRDRLTSLRDQIQVATTREDLLPKLHDLRSVAGMLGFCQLLDICTRMQCETPDGERRSRWPNLLRSVERAIGAIDDFFQPLNRSSSEQSERCTPNAALAM